jgi:hypothetical protein
VFQEHNAAAAAAGFDGAHHSCCSCPQDDDINLLHAVSPCLFFADFVRTLVSF